MKLEGPVGCRDTGNHLAHTGLRIPVQHRGRYANLEDQIRQPVASEFPGPPLPVPPVGLVGVDGQERLRLIAAKHAIGVRLQRTNLAVEDVVPDQGAAFERLDHGHAHAKTDQAHWSDHSKVCKETGAVAIVDEQHFEPGRSRTRGCFDPVTLPDVRPVV